MPNLSASPDLPLNEYLSYFQDLHQSTLLKGLEPSLKRMERLMTALGNPEKSLPPVIHVAGTNGKGSIIAFMKAILEASGLRVHTYTSPHLISFTERISLVGKPISETQFRDHLRHVKSANDASPLTFFEALTATAFLAFQDHPADVLLLETGIGGRLDATNVIPPPAVCVISSLSYDHQNYLGDTLEEIAQEKAHIIKPGTKVVIAPQEHPLLINQTLLSRIKEVGALLQPIQPPTEGILGINGLYQLQNATAALSAVCALLEAPPSNNCVSDGLALARWPGRMEKISDNPEIWLEGAHNKGGFRWLSHQIDLWQKEEARPLHVFLAMGATRNPQIAMECLADKVEKVYAVDMDILSQEKDNITQRFHSSENIVRVFSEKGISCEILPLNQLYEKLIQESENFPRKIVTGSLYLVGKVLSLFNGKIGVVK